MKKRFTFFVEFWRTKQTTTIKTEVEANLPSDVKPYVTKEFNNGKPLDYFAIVDVKDNNKPFIPVN